MQLINPKRLNILLVDLSLTIVIEKAKSSVAGSSGLSNDYKRMKGKKIKTTRV